MDGQRFHEKFSELFAPSTCVELKKQLNAILSKFLNDSRNDDVFIAIPQIRLFGRKLVFADVPEPKVMVSNLNFTFDNDDKITLTGRQMNAIFNALQTNKDEFRVFALNQLGVNDGGANDRKES